MCTRKFPDPKSIDNEALLKKIQSRSQLAPVIRQCLQVLPDDRPSMKGFSGLLSIDDPYRAAHAPCALRHSSHFRSLWRSIIENYGCILEN